MRRSPERPGNHMPGTVTQEVLTGHGRQEGGKREMAFVSESEMLFYGGLAAMAVSAVLAAAGAGVFMWTGRRLRARLEEEYGRLC
ncbi:hypothetical protein D3Z50_10955 [Clostridiaceae bacterium]|nr:hypothetical protein [Clostridiaceae bacterium]